MRKAIYTLILFHGRCFSAAYGPAELCQHIFRGHSCPRVTMLPQAIFPAMAMPIPAEPSNLMQDIFLALILGLEALFLLAPTMPIVTLILSDVITYIEENASGIIDIPEDAETLYGSGFWNYINLFLGPHFSIRATQNLYFDFRALGGLSIIRAPNQELTITYDG